MVKSMDMKPWSMVQKKEKDLTRELGKKGNDFTSATMGLKGLITDKSPFLQ